VAAVGPLAALFASDRSVARLPVLILPSAPPDPVAAIQA
jgi:hypothetical protein